MRTVEGVQPNVPPNLDTERDLFAAGANLVGCVDEAGRGPLAGGVHLAVVVLSPDAEPLEGVDDSKRLSEARRRTLVPRIESWATSSTVASSDAREIDLYGIMGALRLALRRAIASLPAVPDALVIDGNYDFLHRPEPVPIEPWHGSIPELVTLPYGDHRSSGVAAASILAKTSRDEEMYQLDRLFPGYEWAVNKGYGTQAHREAIRRLGPSVQHRRSFRLL